VTARAVRVIGQGTGTHLEVRLPGADANPYLALTAACAAIAHGLTDKRTPPSYCIGDPYADRQALPVRRDLAEALSYFDGSNYAKEALGTEAVRHYARAAQAEIDEHRGLVHALARHSHGLQS
jgi:Glutamine synthetase